MPYSNSRHELAYLFLRCHTFWCHQQSVVAQHTYLIWMEGGGHLPFCFIPALKYAITISLHSFQQVYRIHTRKKRSRAVPFLPIIVWGGPQNLYGNRL